jgi:hypothetical protein
VKRARHWAETIVVVVLLVMTAYMISTLVFT